MIYQISGSYTKNHWDIRGDIHVPGHAKLNSVFQCFDPAFQYSVYLDSKELLLGSDAVIELLAKGRRLINDHIMDKQTINKAWRRDFGQI